MRTLHRICLGHGLVVPFVLLAVSSASFRVLPTEKVTVEELVAKHLESIGPAQNRKAVSSRIIFGSSSVVFRSTPTGEAYGRAVLASEGAKSLIGMIFESPVYPREQFGFNGSTFMAGFVTPGTRSSLGSFLMLHDLVFKQGLAAGVLSSAWPLLDLTARNAKVEYAGTKKVNGRTLHELRYSPRGGSDLEISLFFDETTFQHARTEYRRLVAAANSDRSYGNVQERESRYKMVEEFSDFKPESGLNLPHIYSIEFTADTQRGTFQGKWTLTLTRFVFNEKLDPNSFNIVAD